MSWKHPTASIQRLDGIRLNWSSDQMIEHFKHFISQTLVNDFLDVCCFIICSVQHLSKQ